MDDIESILPPSRASLHKSSSASELIDRSVVDIPLLRPLSSRRLLFVVLLLFSPTSSSSCCCWSSLHLLLLLRRHSSNGSLSSSMYKSFKHSELTDLENDRMASSNNSGHSLLLLLHLSFSSTMGLVLLLLFPLFFLLLFVDLEMVAGTKLSFSSLLFPSFT